MSVNLKKGEKVDLTKGNAGLKSVIVGLGWDMAEQSKKGFFKRAQPETIDCDAIAFLLDDNEKLNSTADIVFYNNLKHSSGAVVHRGDNLTGEGEGDDEQILIDLSAMPEWCSRIVILVSIYQADDKNQHFGMIKNAFVRLVNASDNREICIYNLSENYDNRAAIVFGELYKKGGEWKFNAIGQPLAGWRVSDLAERYGLPLNVWKNR